MKTIDVKNVLPVKFTGGNSFRVVLNKDNVGFAMMKTVVEKGGAYKWHYLHHKEACYCVSGSAILEDLSTGEKHEIYPGITYIVDQHQPHLFTAIEETILISVFNPPLNGDEKHDENGNYKL